MSQLIAVHLNLTLNSSCRSGGDYIYKCVLYPSSPQGVNSLLILLAVATILKLALKSNTPHFLPKTVAHRLNPTSTDEFCPLCRHPTRETQGHVLGGCTTTIMAGLKCARHGRATGLILSALRDGTQGNAAMFAHAETVELSLNRLPPWFPRHPEATDYLYGLLSKPDIILLPHINNQSLDPHQLPTPQQKEAIFFEISYTTDGGVTKRFTEKLAQHAEHADYLRTQGWTVTTIPVIFTYSACVTTTMRTALANHGLRAAWCAN